MPKKIGGRMYFHKDYIKRLPMGMLYDVISCLEVAEGVLGSFEWNTVRIKPDGVGGVLEIAFQYSPDFDTADEPEVKQTVVCVPNDNTWKVLDVKKHKNTIWHHKWMWVEPDYKGFDYTASKKRSALWKPYVTKPEIPKIGNKTFWDSIKSRWEGKSLT
jgi:hypothetical protein